MAILKNQKQYVNVSGGIVFDDRLFFTKIETQQKITDSLTINGI